MNLKSSSPAAPEAPAQPSDEQQGYVVIPKQKQWWTCAAATVTPTGMHCPEHKCVDCPNRAAPQASQPTLTAPGMGDSTELLRRATRQLKAWHELYGRLNTPALPPAGDVRLMEDIDEFLAVSKEASPPPPSSDMLSAEHAQFKAWEARRGVAGDDAWAAWVYRAAIATAPKEPSAETCKVNEFLSCICSRGTKGCNEKHKEPSAGEAVLRQALEMIRDWPINERNRMQATYMRKLAYDTLKAIPRPHPAHEAPRVTPEMLGAISDTLSRLEATKPPLDAEQEREKFEAWADARPGARLRSFQSEDYDYPLGRLMLEAWLARAALAATPDQGEAK